MYPESCTTNASQVYLVHAKPSDYLVNNTGTDFSRDDYYARPENYSSVFATKVGWPARCIHPTYLREDCPIPYPLFERGRMGSRFPTIDDKRTTDGGA